jgi:FkbM family methyltransferase
MTATGSDLGLLPSRFIYYARSLVTLITGIHNWPRVVPLFLPGWRSEPVILRLRNGLRFKVRQAMDVWVIKETCLDREYEQASVAIDDGWTVVDIGAGLGDFAIMTARQRPGCTVHAYEPLPGSFELLVENCALNGVSNVIPHCAAIGARDGSLSLVASEVAVMSSTSAIAEDGDAQPVEALSLESALRSEGIDACDYLKIDCEGAEFDILPNTSSDVLRRVRNICLEYHDNATGGSHADLVALLRERGFDTRVTPSRVHWYLGLLHAARDQEH